MTAALLAIDWGTTNRRIYCLTAEGAVVGASHDARGMLAMDGGDYAAEIAVLRAQHGDLPVLIAGMAGSNRGWTDAGYCDCPADIDALSAHLRWVEPGRTAIVPGVRFTDASRADVMRGEEVQLLGAVLAGHARADGLLCQPGTHCKWAEMRGGRIAGFTTAMIGELHALLRTHSLLAPQLRGDAVDGPAFRAGVARAANHDLLANLFDVRASHVLERRADADAASYASGLMIGADVAARPLDDAIGVIAEPHLGALYTAAIAVLGGNATIIDSRAAFVAGIMAIWRSL